MGPLEDVLVVDLSRALAGPHATMMLGDLGARVIKVEAPGHGDDTRGWGPPFVGDPDDRASRRTSSRRTATRSRSRSTSRPRTTATCCCSWSTGPTCWSRTSAPACSSGSGSASSRCMERNPRLVVLSITGFGHDGPEGGRAGYDQIAQGEAGLMSLTGSGPEDPQRVGVPIADLLSGMYGAYGVVAALQRAAPHRPRHRRPDLAARRGGRRARLPGHAVDGGRRGRPRAGQPPPVDRAVRAVPLPRRRGADRARQRGPVAAVLRGLRPRPGRRRAGHQPRAGRQPPARDRGGRGGVRRLGRRAAARAAGRGRRTGRQGAHARRGLRLGPGREPGPAARRRAPDARVGDPARAAAAVLRRRRRRGHPRRPRRAADARPAPGDAIRAWLDGDS